MTEPVLAVTDVDITWKCSVPEMPGLAAGLALAAVRPETANAAAATTVPTAAKSLLLCFTMMVLPGMELLVPQPGPEVVNGCRWRGIPRELSRVRPVNKQDAPDVTDGAGVASSARR